MYTKYTKSSVFPQNFCGVRWVENASVAERAIEILPHLEIFVSKSIEEGTAPNSESFKTVSKAVSDKSLRLKLAFFSSTAQLVEPFLRDFQGDSPMAPFLYDDLYALTVTLMQRVVKADILEKTYSVSKIDLTDKNIFVSIKDFELDFATKDAFKKVGKISQSEFLQLKEDMRRCIIKIIAKFQERSPMKFN